MQCVAVLTDVWFPHAFCILEASYSFLNAFEMLKEQPKFFGTKTGSR